MLIQFSFKNYKTFKDRINLSMIASNYDKDTNESDNVIHIDELNLRLLKSTVIYGANASGKSKFIDALRFFKDFILLSSKDFQKGESINVTPFRLNATSKDTSSEFEIVFLLDNIIYRYGFEANSKEVISEWLYYKPKSREIELFYRDFQKFEIHESTLSKAFTLVKEGLIRNNALMLSVLAQFNDEIANSILSYFDSLVCISGLDEMDYKNNSIVKVKEGKIQKNQVLELLKSADLGIQDVRFEDITTIVPEKLKAKLLELQESMKEYDPHALSSIRTKHVIYDDENKETGAVEFLMAKDESHGTQKYFYLTGLILDALEKGTILVVDELDSKLHPNLVCKIVSLFNSEKNNPKNAQLIFNTHDTNLLSSGIFRRDQIWFIDKNQYGASKLYSLADFKTTEVRKNESFEENYIRGKYGATPFLGEFDEVTKKILSKDGETK